MRPPRIAPFSASVLALADTFKGQDIGAAERIIQDARRLLWTQHFTGHPLEDVAFGLSMPAATLELAVLIAAEARGDLYGGEYVFTELRACLYVGAFAGQAGTRFGDAFLARVQAQGGPLNG